MRLWIAIALVVLAVGSIAVYKFVLAKPVPVAVVVAPPAPPSIHMPAYVDARPPAKKFTGSAACGDCHDDELAGWKKSWHMRALSPATDKFVVGGDAHFKGTSSEATMLHHGAQRVMTTQGPDGRPGDFNIDWVIGGKRMQDSVTVFPDGRWQVLPIYFHVADKSWVDYTETKQGALTPDHPFWWTNARRMANHECLDCHTTNLAVTHDDATGTWTTTATDFSVACESCHGPSGIHADSTKKADIIQPAKAGAVGVSACARCHGPRQPLWPLLDADHAFRLGMDYDENYDPIVITLPGGGTSSDFFADGRPSTSSFEYQAMLQSACYRKGNATCLTCHTAPHAPSHRKAELRDEPDKLCKSCHQSLAVDHSHHKTATCLACHMAPVVSGVLDHFADHTIDVPAPTTTERHKVPNACGVCHADRTPAVLSAQIQTWWPDAAKRQARRERLADAFDEATAKESASALRTVIADADEAPTVRGAAAIMFARRGGAPTSIVPLLASPLTILRAKACEALGDAHAKVAADQVADKLADPSLRVRLACSLALLDMRDPRGELALTTLANDPATSHLMIPHLELGHAMIRRHDYAAAQKELLQVAQLAPYFADGLVDLAATYASLGNLDEARRRVAAVLQLEPRHRGALALSRKLQP